VSAGRSDRTDQSDRTDRSDRLGAATAEREGHVLRPDLARGIDRVSLRSRSGFIAAVSALIGPIGRIGLIGRIAWGRRGPGAVAAGIGSATTSCRARGCRLRCGGGEYSTPGAGARAAAAGVKERAAGRGATETGVVADW
jgi:hypothetical protein